MFDLPIDIYDRVKILKIELELWRLAPENFCHWKKLFVC